MSGASQSQSSCCCSSSALSSRGSWTRSGCTLWGDRGSAQAGVDPKPPPPPQRAGRKQHARLTQKALRGNRSLATGRVAGGSNRLPARAAALQSEPEHRDRTRPRRGPSPAGSCPTPRVPAHQCLAAEPPGDGCHPATAASTGRGPRTQHHGPQLGGSPQPVPGSGWGTKHTPQP